MITTLLHSSKPTKIKNASFLKSLSVLVIALMTNIGNINAQCGPYQTYESFSAAVPAGWVKSGTSALANNIATARSGVYAMRLTGTGDSFKTAQIASAGALSFYYKSVVAGWSFTLESSQDNIAWATVGTYSGAAATSGGVNSYVNVSIASFPANTYFRFTNTAATAKAVFIDDFSIVSTVPSENLTIVPDWGATNCTFNLVSGRVYTYYDNGGSSDSYSRSQTNNVTFVPAAGEQVEMTFNTFNTNSSAANMSLTNTSPALTSYTGTAVPSPAVYLGTAADVNVGTTFSTPTTGTTYGGYSITVRCTAPVATCSNVTSVAVNTATVTASTASVSWTPPGAVPSNGYDYYYQTTATPAPTSGTTPIGASASSPVTISGLSSDTTYYVWVRSNCGGLYGSWVQAPGSFTTKCSAYPVPYLENFNGLNGPLPTCTSADDTSWATNITNGNLFGYVEGTTFFTKPVSLTAGTVYRLTYDYSTLNGVADFDVNYGSTNNTPSTSNINYVAYSHSGISTLSSNVVNFTPLTTGTYYVGFTLQAVDIPGTTQFNLDNISIEVETCLPPTALVASSVTAYAATIDWTPPASVPANGYQYYFSTSNLQPEYSTPPSGYVASGNTVNLSGLTSGTTYYIWVRSDCSGHFSAWSLVKNFTTVTVVVTNVKISDAAGASVGCNTYNFFDSGAAASNYADNETYTYTFTPLAGKKMKVVFSSFATENNWDGLSIYNGNTVAAPLISSGLPAGFNTTTCPAGSFYGTTSPGTIISTAVDGSLTFKFTSDYIITRGGWSATVTCVTSPSITSFTPNNNSCTSGTVVTITGTNFSGAGVPAITSVAFNGVPATFTVVNSTTITATLPAGLTSGLISVSNAEATAYSTSAFSTYLPPPTTTGVTICAGGSGTLSTSSTCQGYVVSSPYPTYPLSGTWNTSTSPTAFRPNSSTNSATCGFSTTTTHYEAINFQVSATGLYNFEMVSGVDGMGYITTGAFTAGSCSAGFVIGDDDSGNGLEPRLSVNLTAGVTYTLYSTTYGVTVNGTFNWTVSSPVGGQIMLYSNSPMQWFTVASGGTAIGNGSPFNPVGVAGSGLPNTNTAGTYVFYAGCPSNPNCRTATNFVINPLPVAGTVSANQTICTGTQPANIILTGSTGTIQWQSSPDNITFTDIPGATSATLSGATIGSLTAVKYFRAVVQSGTCGILNSAVVTVNISPLSVAGSVSANQSICAGSTPSNITLTGNTGAIQWQSSPDNVTFTNIAGATAATLTGATIGSLAATKYFMAVVQSGSCSAVNSAVVTVAVSPATVAGTVSANQSICTGNMPADITLSGSTGTIQWQSSPDNVTFTNIPGATAATLTGPTIGSLTATKYFMAVVQSGVCSAINSAVITVTVSPATVAGSVSANQSICSGSTPSNITLSGSTGAIQWQSSPDNITFTNIAGATAATLTGATIGSLAATKYFMAVVQSGSCSAVNSAIVTVTVSPATVAGTVSANQSICSGSTPSNITLSGSTGAIQWQSSPDNITFTNIAGATAATLTGATIGSLAATKYFRAVVQSGACSAINSAVVTVTVSPATVAGTVSANQSICSGSTPSNITLSGSTGSIQWQSSPDNITFTNIAGATAATLTGATIGSLAATKYFMAVVQSGACSSVNSSVVTVTVSPTTVAGTVSANQSICSGSTPSNITLSGSTGAIQWQSSPDNITFTNIAGATAATLTGATIGPLAATKYFRAVVQSGACSTINSAVVTVTVSPATVAGTVSANQSICSGSTPSNITLSGSTGSIQWQSSPDNITFTNIAGATAATLTGATIGSLAATKYFRAVVQSGACSAINSAVVTVTVSPAAVAGTVSANQSICPGLPGNITLSGNTGTIQWQSSTDNVTFGNIGGATSNTLSSASIGSLSVTTYFRAVVTNGVCPPVNSPTVTVTVTPLVAGTAGPSSQTTCTGYGSNLTLSGYSGTITKWQWDSSAAFTTPNDIPGSNAATLTSAQIGLLAANRYFRAEITSGSCTTYSNIVSITFISTKWTAGAWTNGVPNSTTAAIFDGDYTSNATLNACSVQVISGNVIFNSPGSLVVENSVTRTGGTLTFNSGASLVQVNDAAVNSGSITYKRDTTPMVQYDYTYWSSPLSPQTLLGVSPLTMADKYFTFDTALNNYVSVNANNLMDPGRGYIIRAPQGWPTTGTVYNGIFTGGAANNGVPNNGVFTIPVILSGANNYNLFGNPYPSAIDADLFYAANASLIDGTFYFWTHNTAINPTQYSGSDYAIWNSVGGVGTAGGGIGNLTVPDGNIASGQGFFVKSIANGTATFNNSMRLVGLNSQFFRLPSAVATPENLEKHRIWVDIKNNQGAYKQALVGYIETATNGKDLRFDGDVADGGNVVGLYSVLGDDKLSIQGRALPFDINDQVPLGYTTTIAGNFEIGMPQFDGLFLNQNVYLEDKLLNVIHNLKSGNYSFTTQTGTFENRFVLRFTDGTALGVHGHDFDDSSVVVYKDETGIHIFSPNMQLSVVKIFDVRGRFIAEHSHIDSGETHFTRLPTTQQVLLVRIVSETGAVVTKKVVY